MKKRTNDKIYTEISILDKMSNFCSKRDFYLFNWMNETNACKDWILIYHRMEYNEILKGLLERSCNRVKRQRYNVTRVRLERPFITAC